MKYINVFDPHLLTYLALSVSLIEILASQRHAFLCVLFIVVSTELKPVLGTYQVHKLI